MLLNILICSIIGYGFGCFSTAYVIGKINHIDIRNTGSGNAGTTNALRILGMKAGLMTFLGDALKAIIPILLIRLVFNNLEPSWEILALYLGLGVVVGHNYPFWLKFKGGKGIAATAGVIVAIADWRITIVGLILFIGIVGISRYVSLGSLMVAWLIPINTIIFHRADTYFTHMLILSIVFTALAYFRHISNIKKLLSGTERKIGEKTQ
jgi:acyl phosphate:glycerol-3-phosphate acyltransferase